MPINYYHPDQVSKIRNNKGLKEHTEETIYEDFYEFIEEKNYFLSYKMIFILSMLKITDYNGEASLDNLEGEFKKFYKYRFDNNLKMDRSKSPFEDIDFFNNTAKIKRNFL